MPDKPPKNLSINVHDNIGISDLPCSVKVITVSHALLEQARSFLNSGNSQLYKVCVVLCHTALQVEAERIESVYLRKMGLADKATEQLLRWKTNICRISSVSLFESITNKKISDRLDFKGLDNMNKKRNDIMHKGEEATKKEAEDSVDLCDKTLQILQ